LSDPDTIIRDTTARIFADLADPQTLNAATSDAWKAPLWVALEQAGLTRAWVAPEHGGAGAEILDGFEIIRVSGQYAAPVAIAETLLGGHFLDAAGLDCPAGPLTVAPLRLGDHLTCAADGSISGTARAVPHIRDARAIVVIADREAENVLESAHQQASEQDQGQVVALMAPGAFTIAERATDMGGERADITFDHVYPAEIADAPAHWHADTPMLIGAAVRAAQMTGALETVLDLSTRYAAERAAFGRPIAKFQAIQHNLARLAGEVAASLAASGSAADTLQNATGCRQDSRRRGGHPRRRHRPPGPRRHRLDRRAHPAALHPTHVGLARRLRRREPLGRDAGRHGHRSRRRRALAHAGRTLGEG
jgi:alkylation response protein AidB-like acyl-CoA dehydrogenase